MSIAPPPKTFEYPTGDGLPMAETWLHVRAIIHLHQALEDFFRGRDDAFIASDMNWYLEEGTDRKIAPDVLVAVGVPPRPPAERRCYLPWEEGGVIPAAVFEMASKGTWREDVKDKYETYEELGVREYFLFDPEAAYIHPPLQGYQLHGSAYRRIRSPDGELTSELGFRIRAEGELVRLIDGRTNEPILTRAEAVERAELAAVRAVQAAERADQAVAAARMRADAEQQRADALAAELAELRKRLSGETP